MAAATIRTWTWSVLLALCVFQSSIRNIIFNISISVVPTTMFSSLQVDLVYLFFSNEFVPLCRTPFKQLFEFLIFVIRYLQLEMFIHNKYLTITKFNNNKKWVWTVLILTMPIGFNRSGSHSIPLMISVSMLDTNNYFPFPLIPFEIQLYIANLF